MRDSLFSLLALLQQLVRHSSSSSVLPQQEFRSAQEAALTDLTIQESVAHACAHVCLRAPIIAASGSRTLFLEVDTGMALAL